MDNKDRAGIKHKGERVRTPGEEEKVIKAVVMLPYCSTVAGHIERMLCGASIKTVFRPMSMISQVMTGQGSTGSLYTGLFQIPCACWQCYTGQTGCS